MEMVLGPSTPTLEKKRFFDAHSGVTHDPPAFQPLEATIPIRIFNRRPSAIACLIRFTDSSPRKAPPAGIKDGFLTAATSHISARFIPLDFMASRSLVI